MWYRAGQVQVVNGSKNVTGIGTSWLGQVHGGDTFFLLSNRSNFLEVESVTDDTHLILREAYVGTSQTTTYAIIVNYTATTNETLAFQYAELLQATKDRDAQIQTWLTGTATGGPNANGRYPITDINGTVQLVPCPALIDAAVATQQAVQLNASKYPLVKTAAAGTTRAVDASTGPVQQITLNQPTCTLSITNADTSTTIAQHLRLILVQGTGSNLVTWPSNIRWSQSRAPILSITAGQSDIVDLVSLNGGGTWMGFFGGSRVPA